MKSNWLLRFLQRYGCEHDWKWVHNIYGDQINYHGGKRSLWECQKCGKREYKYELYPEGTLFTQMLDKNYKTYYQNIYDNWCKEHEETLKKIKNQLIDASIKGECWFDVVLICDDNKNDRNYYIRYFENLGLKVTTKDKPYDRDKVQIEPFEFHLRWNQ